MSSIPKRIFQKLISLRPVRLRALRASANALGVSSVRIRLPKDSPLYSNAGGDSLELRLDEAIMPAVLSDGRWQIEEIKFLGSFAEADPSVFIDIGANHGLVTRQLLHLVPRIAAAVCFEPHPQNFRVLTRNLEHLPKCHLVQAAIGSSEGELKFYEDQGNVGNYSLNLDAMRGQEYRSITVRCLKATEFNLLGALPEAVGQLPIIWKSDTQGFDESIMTALPDSFWERVRAGIMEMWRIERPTFDRKRLRDILGQFDLLRFSNNPDRNVSIDEVIEYSSGNDYDFRDLYFARTVAGPWRTSPPTDGRGAASAQARSRQQ